MAVTPYTYQRASTSGTIPLAKVNFARGLDSTEKSKLLLIASGALVLGYYSPIDNRTVTITALTAGIGAGLSDYGKFQIENMKNLTTYQRIIGWSALGAFVGISIDHILRPKLNPERI